MFDQDTNHEDKDDGVEENESEDGAQKQTKEHSQITDETAVEEDNIMIILQQRLIHDMYCTLEIERKRRKKPKKPPSNEKNEQTNKRIRHRVPSLEN